MGRKIDISSDKYISMRKKIIKFTFVLILLIVGINESWKAFSFFAQVETTDSATSDDLVFIHHSVGNNWLSHSLHNALLAKNYIDERNDIYYGTDFNPDTGRPDSLTPIPGDLTNMNHWILWFNDYLDRVINHDCDNGINKIIMFKSCYPASNVDSVGTEPGNPFSSDKTLANYKAVYRHPNGPGQTYIQSGYTYKPLFQIFAENPDILFIPVTAPPQHYTATTDEKAHRARLFNNWLKNEAVEAYNLMYPGLNNVAVFDFFDLLAYPDDHPDHPNRLKEEYGGASGNSHPNSTANADATKIFATNQENFIDTAWDSFQGLDFTTDVKANGSDDPISLTTDDTITLTLNLDPGTSAGHNADWWVVVRTPFAPPHNWYHYDLNTSSWMPGYAVTYQDALFNLGSKNIPIATGLPPGTYHFIFGIDLDMNGTLDLHLGRYDMVRVTISP